MIFSGLNTYESTQIKDNESKYPLNCSNVNGKLKHENYEIPFAIEDTRNYQRDYNSMDYTEDTSDSVGRFSLRFTQDDVTQATTDPSIRTKIPMNSGILKPTASIYTDTTKEVDNGYLNAVQKLSKINFPANGLIGEKLTGALNSEGLNCEIYKGVEIAISYSGAYGESGLTWFRLPSYTLHGFIFIDNIYEPFMMSKPTTSYYGGAQGSVNPNYQYVNVYIKYGNLEKLSLLQRIDITSQEMIDAYETPLEIDFDKNVYDNEQPVNFNFFTWFERRRTLYLGDTTDFGEFSDEYCDENNFVSKKGVTLAIYTGLFQYEDPDKINYSWFASNRVINQYPQVELETQTFLSNDNYDLLNDKYNNILSEFANNQDIINNASNDLPWLTEASTVDGWDTGVFTDTMFQTETKYTKGLPTNFYNHNEECQSASTGEFRNQLADYAWYTKYKQDEVSLVSSSYDMKGRQDKVPGGAWTFQNVSNRDGSISFKTKRWSTTGTLIFQYFIDIDGEFNLISTQNVSLSAKGSSINTFKLPNFIGKYYTKNENWKVAVWYSKILEPSKPSDEIDKNWYKIAEVDALSLIKQFQADSAGAGKKAVTWSSEMVDFPQSYNRAYRDESESDNPQPYVDGNDIPYRAIWPMENQLRPVDIAYTRLPPYDLAMILDVGCLYEHKAKIFVDINNQEAGYIGDTAEDDLEDIILNTDGLYNKDWKVLEGGIKIENTKALNWKYDVRHLENYDGRLWVTAKEKTKGDVFADLYYSQQNYPDMILPLNNKGYESHITGLHDFIDQLYVFEEHQISVVKKHLSRELNGIVEPTYQYHKTFDKGAIEWTIKEYEKKVIFTNEEGQYYIDATGGYNKISKNIEKLFQDGFINSETVDYSEIKGEFYVTKFKEAIPREAFFDIDWTRINLRLPDSIFNVDYLAYHFDTQTYWLGNESSSDKFIYLTKDFDGRNKYQDFSNVSQLKRISFDYDYAGFTLYQIKNRHVPLVGFQYPEQNEYRRPIRHTLKGMRNHFFGLMILGNEELEIVDMKLLENGK